MSRGILIPGQWGRYGRFANQIYTLCGVIGIARKQGFDWACGPWINYDHKERFGSVEDVNIYQHLKHDLPEWNGAPYPELNFGWGYKTIQVPHGNYQLVGHFQAPKYFTHAMDEIRHFLTFKDEPAPSEHVAIHWRAGDYSDGPDGHHPRCTKEYYQEAMALMPLGSKFKIFSDDIPGAIAMLGLNQNFEYVSGNNYIEDFKIMKQCHSFITANSTFSGAAAFLANQEGKKIIMPRLWWGRAWGPDHIELTKDVYPENAIVI